MRELDELIQNGDHSEALAFAAGRRPTDVLALIDLDAMHDEAEPYMDFCRAYYQSAGTLDKVEIADWVLSYSTSAFAYLDVEAESAHMLTAAVAEAVNYLAEKLSNTREVDYGPDAGLARAQSAHYQSIAETLRGIEIPIAAKTRAD